MLQPDALAAMPAKEYLEHFHLDFYLSEALGRCSKSESGSSTEVLGSFWQAVLEGTHLQSSDFMQFRAISATPENRRAFVQRLRKQINQLSRDNHAIAVTVLDFYDMIVMLCPDFPLDLVIDAAQFIPQADTESQRLLGERSPIASTKRGADGSLDLEDLVLFQLPRLQRIVEFRFVYPEAFRCVKDFFKRQGQSAFSMDATVTRIALARHLRDALYGTPGGMQNVLRGAAQPSEGALQKVLQGNRGLLEGFAEELTLPQAMREMAMSFELIPPPIPGTLLLKATAPTARSRSPLKESPEVDPEAATEELAEKEVAKVLSATAPAEAPFTQDRSRASIRLAERRRIERTASASLLPRARVSKA